MRSPLAGALSFLLPDPAEAALLAVCLRPDRARAAWDEWLRRGGDLDRYRSLLPLVDAGVRAAGLELEAALAARLAGARLHESIRWGAIRQVTVDALDRLARAGLDPVVVQDVALAATAYRDPTLRHCHALEVLLPPGEMGDAAGLLAAAGFRPGRASGTGADFVHPDGLPVRLSDEPFARIATGADAGRIRARAVPAPIVGLARGPAPEDALALLVARAAVGADRRSLLWVCDASRVIASATELDWDRVVDSARLWGLALPIATMVGWLSSELGLAVPSEAPARMAERVGRGREMRRTTEAALACARADGRAGLVTLLARARGWRERATVVRWTALPTPRALHRAYPGTPTVALPLLYLARPLLATVRSVARRLRPPEPAPGFPGRGAGTAGARSGAPGAREEDRPSASPRSSG
ncbi:MAG TPA: nucleotidyltransferase family protein [Gemmatimonadota bacterium]|nr:nucleotidyltransferase family protein [Gemmatimonadota bacterium]